MDKRKSITAVIACFLFFILFVNAFAAEKYPTREIDVVTTNPPGGMVDLGLRLMTDGLGKNLGVPVVVNNRPGAGGATGALFLIKSKPDGYTIGCLASRDTVIIPATIPNVPYKYSDLIPLSKYASAPNAVYCKGDAPWKTWEELVADAKRRPKQITYGVSTNSISQFQIEGFIRAAGISLVRVSLADAQQATVRVTGGNLDIVAGVPSTITGQLKAGTLRVLLLISPERMSLFPQIPIHKEKGYPDPPIFASFGFFAPVGMPNPIRETLEKALDKTINDPALKKRLGEIGQIVEYLPSEAYGKEIEEDYKRIADIVRTSSPKK